MKICFPVQNNNGMDSRIYNHFGSAPLFIVVDTDTNEVTVINNRDQHHKHGACNPVGALNGQVVDCIVVGSIGAGALSKLNQAGIKVYQAQGQTVRDNVAMFKVQALPEFMLQHTCRGHEEGCLH